MKYIIIKKKKWNEDYNKFLIWYFVVPKIKILWNIYLFFNYDLHVTFEEAKRKRDLLNNVEKYKTINYGEVEEKQK